MGAVSDGKHVCGIKRKDFRCIHSSGPDGEKVGIFKCLVCGDNWTIEFVHQGTAGKVPAIRRNGKLQVIIGEKTPARKGVRR